MFAFWDCKLDNAVLSLDRRAHIATFGSTIALLGAIVFACSVEVHAGTMSTTPELRRAAMTACPGDVIRLCPTAMFDEEKIFACMKANRAQLSPNCGAIFDKGAKTVRQ